MQYKSKPRPKEALLILLFSLILSASCIFYIEKVEFKKYIEKYDCNPIEYTRGDLLFSTNNRSFYLPGEVKYFCNLTKEEFIK